MIYCDFCGKPSDYISLHKAAVLLGVTTRTMRKYVLQGRFPGTEKVKGKYTAFVYRIPVSSLLPLLQEKKQ